MTPTIRGIVPVIATPFNPDDSIDVGSLRRVVDFVVSREMAAMCLPAYGSEVHKLSERERDQVITIALEQNRQRIPLIAQVNHHAACVAAACARRYEQMGATVVGVTLPRQFSGTDADLLAYVGPVADAVRCPLLVQDFNPNGPTIDAAFMSLLHERHPNACYFKIEEPMPLDKLARVGQVLGDRVHVFAGWGGCYMLESLGVTPGINGVMPGAAMCDAFDRIYRLYRRGQRDDAYSLFASLMPWIVFSLQHFELFLLMEKRLLVSRGVIDDERRRSGTCTFSGHVNGHVGLLLEQVLRVLQSSELPNYTRA